MRLDIVDELVSDDGKDVFKLFPLQRFCVRHRARENKRETTNGGGG